MLIDDLRAFARDPKGYPDGALSVICNDAADSVERLIKELAIAGPVVTAACRLVAADTYKHPVLSREDAVKAGVAELHDAVGKWHGAQPAAQCSPQDTVHE